MMSSIDGRLLPDRWTAPASGIDRAALFRHYDATAARFEADGWIVGRKTMQAYAKGVARPAARTTGASVRGPHLADRKGRDLAVALDPRGVLHYGQDNAGGDAIVAVLGENVPDDYLAELREDGVSYCFAGRDGKDLVAALDSLGDVFGAKTLLLEGGGVVNGAFLKARLIDEISLLVYPGLDGLSGSPGIFEGEGTPEHMPSAGQTLRPLATETLEGGVVWLRYAVEHA
jgi:5-amino-6-(5-phosphoribosylamino)uracil reductase